jgi:hypothetical protein
VNRKFIASLSVFALLLTVYSSCSRIDTTDIGNNLIPAVDNVSTFEASFDVITDNFQDVDTSRIFDEEDHALGTISNDPIFGKTTAAIYFNVSPAAFGSFPFINKDSIKFPIDSVVLSLALFARSGTPFTVTAQVVPLASAGAKVMRTAVAFNTLALFTRAPQSRV